MMDNGDNSSHRNNWSLPAGLNDDVDVDAGMLNVMYDLSAGVSDNDNENDGRDDSVESQQRWNILMGSRRPSSVSISLDGVDSRLLKKARHEAPEAIKRIKEKLFGKEKNCNAFMDPTLLGLMKKTFINKNISRDPASSSNIIAFLHVELMLSFYKVRRSKCQDRSHVKARISRFDYRFPPQCTLILSTLVPFHPCQRLGYQVVDTAKS